MYGITMNFTGNGLLPLIAKLKEVQERAALIVVTSLVGVTHDRIHKQGKAADNSQIGTYSPEYMVVRTGNYKDATTAKSGKMAGKVTKAGKFSSRTIRLNTRTGVFTGEEKVGKNRPNYHRDSNTTVILSLTRQQENDWSVIETGTNQFGLGYKNPLNFSKSQWEEETYKKKIFALTPEEQKKADQTINDYVKNALS